MGRGTKIAALLLVGGLCMAGLTGCTREEVMSIYNTGMQLVGEQRLTAKDWLQGVKTPGRDDYTGRYAADYEGYTGTEYLFGGAGIEKRKKPLTVTCTLDIREGTAALWLDAGSQASPLVLIEETGSVEKTIDLPAGSNFIKLGGEELTGSLTMEVQ